MLSSLLFVVVVSFFGIPTPAQASTPVACTMDAKLCPDGVTYVGRDGNRNCEWQLCPGEKDSCAPYVCNDGTRINKCTPDGTIINYFAAPCLTHGGEIDASQSFSDVPPTHEYAEAIAYVKAQGIVEGYADGTYKPDLTINRAEFTKIIVGSVFGTDSIHGSGKAIFNDVQGNEWYAPFIEKAVQEHIVHGYGVTDAMLSSYTAEQLRRLSSFLPSNHINFAEAAKILVNAMHIEMRATDVQGNWWDKPSYLGDPYGGTWWKEYVNALLREHALPSNWLPDKKITRGEMAEMIWRLKTGNTERQS